MNIVSSVGNYNWVGRHIRDWVDNFIYLVLNAFHRAQTAFDGLISKHYSKKKSNSPSSDPQILSFRVLKNNKVHFRKIRLLLQASEKLYSIESDSKNRTRSSIIERSICLEMNKTEILSDGGE